jgi:hypothetical protein
VTDRSWRREPGVEVFLSLHEHTFVCMPAYERYDCAVCDDTFRAYPEANATHGPYCSPACESEGEGLA